MVCTKMSLGLTFLIKSLNHWRQADIVFAPASQKQVRCAGRYAFQGEIDGLILKAPWFLIRGRV